ncbi:hypothetical protein BH10PSE15_BH10PSE15_11550 [soil metagenome]
MVDDLTAAPARRRWPWVLLAVVGAVAAIAGAIAWPIVSDPRIRLGDRQPFGKGPYGAFAQPWAGANDPILKVWAPHADRISVDLPVFPANSEIAWAWPWPPHGTAVGVWGYNFLSFGQYDGGSEEVAITPRRVRDITQLRQSFDWRSAIPVGDANVLTEFYLRSDPADSESKLVEIGWILHSPRRTRNFVENGKQIGIFTDAQGRKWRVSIDEKYCTLMPLDARDIPAGSLDMLEAVRWLQGKGVVPEDAWFTGVALGVEPLWGWGTVHVRHWNVEYR